MDSKENRNIQRTRIQPTISQFNKKKHNHCKNCGKPFIKGYYTKTCPECKSKKEKEKATIRLNINEWIKEKIKKNRGIVYIDEETQPHYKYDAFVPYTAEICSTCKDNHESDKRYEHTFTTRVQKIGLPTETIKEILLFTKEKHKEAIIESLEARK